MRCSNCQKEIPDEAKMCVHCETPVESPPTEEEMKAAGEVFSQLDEKAQQSLLNAMQTSETGEDFANAIMVGPCPSCGGTEVGDCENDPDIENICIGRCFSCGHLWCLECGKLLRENEKNCECLG